MGRVDLSGADAGMLYSSAFGNLGASGVAPYSGVEALPLDTSYGTQLAGSKEVPFLRDKIPSCCFPRKIIAVRGPPRKGT